MENLEILLSKLQKNNSDFSLYLRQNLLELFPLEPTLNTELNYDIFYLILYRVFILFGWKITRKELVKVQTQDLPFDLVKHILTSLNFLEQKYFSTLFMLISCQNIFNYGYKSGKEWPLFESWVQTQEYITPKYIDFIRYRWRVTDTCTRKEISNKLNTLIL